ncbi:MAG TPA: DUF1893 domain-containing protein [Fusobacterium sp.]|uniref:DUF1893 domain-containing protein n=1 Tax=Fusobacterium sp. TaxID=68766 RepID=UPI002F3E4605
MDDIMRIKKFFLENRNANIMIFKDNEIVYCSNEKGIFSMYNLYKNNKNILNNAVIADKIVGRAIAIIAIASNVRGIYAEIISENAYDLLIKNNIRVEYWKKVLNILNHNDSDKCPVEKLAENISSADALILSLDEFLKGGKSEN